MKIFIVGGSKEVYFLAKAFISRGYDLTIVNENEEFCKRLSRTFKATVVKGDGSKPYMLEDAGIADADMVIALTENDPDNLVVCQIAEKIYGIKKTFAIVNDPENIQIFKQLGVDTVISTTNIISSLIEQRAIVDDIQNLMPIAEDKISLMEVDVAFEHPVRGKKIHEIDFPKDAIISCIVRHQEVIIAKGDTQIMDKDRLVIMSKPKVQSEVLKCIRGRVD
ncbi:potassium channel family protein [Petrocella sp. FN5]|uniref:potassium channel family protein n=1 Tax=Petrocella sp. FN5 TaxID=3032002 RepID=UPI0023DC5006|nr:NAD-binding protein [Petrocella sp. FN5]MDF1615939.1 NAD-binding protein [Petrocella sp. FN5]